MIRLTQKLEECILHRRKHHDYRRSASKPHGAPRTPRGATKGLGLSTMGHHHNHNEEMGLCGSTKTATGRIHCAEVSQRYLEIDQELLEHDEYREEIDTIMCWVLYPEGEVTTKFPDDVKPLLTKRRLEIYETVF